VSNWIVLNGKAVDIETGQMEDPVSNPSHYKSGGIESIDYIKAFLSKEEYRGFLRGNISKYLHRYTYKGKPLEDLKKAQFYLDRLIKETAGE
jgi:hypothetical protein